MHEMMVAQSLFGAILAEAEKEGGRPVAARISCGMLNAINDELLSSAFEVVAKGTCCEGIRLEVEHKAMQGKCRECGEVFGFEIIRPGCAKCGSEDFELLADAPLMLEEIEFETE